MTDSNLISVEVKVFGYCRSLVGEPGLTVAVPRPATVGDVLEAVFRRCEALRPLAGKLLVAVNETYATPDLSVDPEDEIALFPPVSGGADDGGMEHDDFFVEITDKPIDAREIASALLRGEAGAVVTFDGTVRNNTKGRRTLYLEYEAYPGMALKTMRQIAEEAKARRPIDRIALVHRVGRLEIGESSVVIVVTSAHRADAFDACRFAIDRLKQIVPIWKHEYFEDGDVWVEGEGKTMNDER